MIPCNITRTAFQEAEKSNCPDFKFGAVVFYKKRVIAKGHNISRKTHPCGSGVHCTIHAEVSAILRARYHWGKNMKGLSLFVARLSKGGDIKPSKPCPDCYDFASSHGLKIYYME